MADDANPLAECRLDVVGLRTQRERYRRLGAFAEEIERQPEALTVHFSPDLERGLLEQVIAVESECCPFFRFDYSEPERRLRIGVGHADQRAALDALRFALSEQ